MLVFQTSQPTTSARAIYRGLPEIVPWAKKTQHKAVNQKVVKIVAWQRWGMRHYKHLGYCEEFSTFYSQTN